MKGLSKSSTKICLLAIAIIGLVLIFVGGLLLGLFHLILHSMVQQNLALGEGKESYDKWKTTPIPVIFSVYVFNVTNPDQIKNGAKPIVKEVGPFVYRQQRRKEVMSWDHQMKTVTYKDIKSFYFEESKSVNISTDIHVLNMPIMGLIGQVTKIIDKTSFKPAIYPLLSLFNSLFAEYNDSLVIKRTAKQLLFDGYKFDFLEDVINAVKVFTKIESPLPNNTFGFLYGKNNTGDGIFTVYTGEDELSKYTQILEWNGARSISNWNDEYCDMLNGTDGGQFSPPITKNDRLYVFTAELCRSVYLEFVEEVEVKGILAYRFSTPESLFASPVVNEDNKCYCTRPDLCYLHGILDITSCKKGVAIGVTAPHFLYGHEDFIDGVDGLDADVSEHNTFVDIEPNTGVVLSASRKLQMNYLLTKNENFELTSNVPTAVFPLVWLKEEATIDDALANTFKNKVKTPVTVAKSVLTACIVLGVLWIATAGIVTGCILFKQKKVDDKQKAQYTAVASNPNTENGTTQEKYKPENA